MSVKRVRQYLKQWNRQDEVVELQASTATVALAAEALGVIPARIAKSVTLRNKDRALLVVAAGDGRIDNQKFKKQFGFSPKMLKPEEALHFTGYQVGGICPFDLSDVVDVYLDEGLKRFATIFPACGSSSSMIELTIAELETYSKARGWVDVCKIPE